MDINFFRRAPRTGAANPQDADLGSLLMLDDLLEAGLEETRLARCTWLLDAGKQIAGYLLGWAMMPANDPAAGPELQKLVRIAANAFVHPAKGWSMGDTTLLFEVTPALAAALDWQGLPPGRVVLCVATQHLQPEDGVVMRALREQGFGVLLSGGAPTDPAMLELATHLDIGEGDPALLEGAGSVARRPLQCVATRMRDWPQFEVCAAQRVPMLVSPGVEPPQPATPRATLQPEAMLIARVLQMVQANQDIREIEVALKHDAALTYRLLRHINSPAVGAGVEIESLRHAVAMLGYARLFRWLSILLGTGDGGASVPFLMEKAIIRGRFVELLGRELLGARHADNLFLVGMFSLMHHILGVPLPQLLEQIQLAEGVKLGILSRTGVYGPFLALARACERGDPDAGALADQLFLTASQVNAAHFGAIAWAREVTGGKGRC